MSAYPQHFPHHFSTVRKSGDSIELELWEENGEHIATINLTHYTALELVRDVATEVVHHPYGR